MSVGIIVEGDDDLAVYPVLIKRIDPTIGRVHRRKCCGRRKLEDKFVVFLKEFAKNPVAFDVRKALIIRDSDCNDPEPIEQQLQDIFARSSVRPAFRVSFHATKCKLESWLLADEDAINAVSMHRGGPGGIQRIALDLENLREADQLYRRTLSQAGLQDTDEVMKEIAQRARLDWITGRCPRFRDFIQKVTGP